MKTIWSGRVLGIGLAVVFAGVQARAMQWSGGNSMQQSGSWEGSQAGFGGRGNGFGGQPSQFAPQGRWIIYAQPTTTRAIGPVGSDRGRGVGFRHGTSLGHNGAVSIDTAFHRLFRERRAVLVPGVYVLPIRLRYSGRRVQQHGLVHIG